MKLNQKIIKKVTDKVGNITISDNKNYYTIYVDNSCGEDFQFEINKGENEIEDIISYCDNFDSEEHFKLWYGANRGEPSNPRTLLDNCEEIEETLKELSTTLTYLDY